jgi:hypothetical protein
MAQLELMQQMLSAAMRGADSVPEAGNSPDQQQTATSPELNGVPETNVVSAEDNIDVPPFIRGSLRKLYVTRERLKRRLKALAYGDSPGSHGGIQKLYRFQTGEQGGMECAIEGLVSDLTGCDSARNKEEDELICALHEAVFENYNQWARYIDAGVVYSDKYHDYGSRTLLATVVGKKIVSTSPENNAAGGNKAVSPMVEEGKEQEAQEQEPEEKEAVPGSDVATRLHDLMLWYAIRAETANLRFMPEYVICVTCSAPK